MTTYGPIVLRETVARERRSLWSFIVDGEKRQAWWPGLSLQPELGGAVALAQGRTAKGEINVFEEGQTIGFRWFDDAAQNETTVVILLRPDGVDFEDTVVTVIESGFAGHADAEALFAGAAANWQALLAELSDYAGVVDELAAELEGVSEAELEAELYGDAGTGQELAAAEADDAAQSDDAGQSDDTAQPVDAAEHDDAAEPVDTAEHDDAAEQVDTAQSDADGESALDAVLGTDTDTDADTDADADADAGAEAVAEQAEPEISVSEIPEPEVSEPAASAEFSYTGATSEVPLLLPELPEIVAEEPLLVDGVPNLQQYAETGEVTIKIVGADGISIDDSDLEEAGMSEWERLLQGDPLDE